MKDSVTVDMFKIDLLDPILALYNKSVQRIVNEREQGTSVPVYLKLRDHFPHFTPCKSDIIVYTTVEEGQSATKDDVIKYLDKLKYDLKIGTPPFPSCVVLCGDQQTWHNCRIKED